MKTYHLESKEAPHGSKRLVLVDDASGAMHVLATFNRPYAELADRVVLWNNNYESLKTLLGRATAHETEPCSFDHDGYCQEHACDAPCLFKEARELLSGLEEKK
jgi:hypothetical protein